jgi:hypothetical protein
VAAFLILFLAACAPVKTAGDLPREVQEERFCDIVRDLHSLNLVNGLHLSREQIDALLPLLDEAGRLEEEEKQVKSESFPRYYAVLVKLKARLEKHSDITDELQEELDRVSLPSEKKIAAIRLAWGKLVQKVKLILTPNQKTLLLNYEPCMVPTPNISQPDRIGGVVDSQKLALQLARMRKMTPPQFQAARKKILDEKRLRMSVNNTDYQTRSVLRQMEKAMDDARAMDDAEFALKKDELANINLPGRINPAYTAPAPFNPDNKEDEFISRYLLNPSLSPPLRKGKNIPDSTPGKR